MLQGCDIGYPRVLATAAGLRQFVIGFRLQRDPHALDATRIAGTVKQHARDADPRIVAASHQTREQIELPVPGSHGGGVEDALDLMGVARLRLHDHADPLHREVRHGRSPLYRHAITASMTRFVSWGSRTSIDSTPACLAG